MLQVHVRANLTTLCDTPLFVDHTGAVCKLIIDFTCQSIKEVNLGLFFDPQNVSQPIRCALLATLCCTGNISQPSTISHSQLRLPQAILVL
jgi:hypothetical protein